MRKLEEVKKELNQRSRLLKEIQSKDTLGEKRDHWDERIKNLEEQLLIQNHEIEKLRL